jgi:hypothetical protein
MNTTSPIEPHTSPAPGIIPEPSQVYAEAAASTREGSRGAAGTTAAPAARRGPLARVLAALRGDKYMVGAYAPGGPPPSDG